MDKKQLILEYTKCLKSPAHVIESYFETFDKTNEGYVPFKLFEGQRKLIANYEANRFNLVLKYRQAGISTVTAAYAAVKTAFATSENPEKILILANKQETSIEFLNKITYFIKQLPNWQLKDVATVNDEGKVEFPKGAQKHVKLKNGSEIKAVATSKDALRGYTPTILILDEAAFIEGGQELWTACLASIGTGGKAFLISTPNGLDEIYHDAYEGSINNVNKFVITHLKWWEDPRFNRDLKMIKTTDVINWLEKPESERHEEIIYNIIPNDKGYIDETTRTRVMNYLEAGYRPHSSWYENMCRDMNLNKRMINQELECAFIGSGDNVIDALVLEKQVIENVREPLYKDSEWDGLMWVWKEPEPGHRYIAAGDPSRGDSEDATGYCIIDFDTFEQVAEYHGKVTPDILGYLANKYGLIYNALTTGDITGGMGIPIFTKLKELNFPAKLIHYDDQDDLTLFYGAPENVTPGINYARLNRRTQIIQALEEAIVRGGFKIRSIRLINELKKFVYKNGKPDHMKGSHDDLIMALGMALFVANTSFKKLDAATKQTIAMLDSWKVKSHSVESPATKMLEDINIRPDTNKIYENNNIYNNQQDILRNTRDFSWVFGNINKYKP